MTYISGPITGVTDWKEKFEQAENGLSKILTLTSKVPGSSVLTLRWSWKRRKSRFHGKSTCAVAYESLPTATPSMP